MAARKLLRSISSLSIKSASPSSSSVTRLRPISAFSSLIPVRHFSSDEPPPSSPPGFDSTKKRPNLRLPGCDYLHWFVVVDEPTVEGATCEEIRDKMIDDYICTLAKIVGSKEVAREKIYSVSTTCETCYCAFGALLSEELAYKLRDVPSVRFVLPDSYIDAQKQDYGGTPFVEGKAAPDDAKYHKLCIDRQWERKKQYHHSLKQQVQQQHGGNSQGAQFVHGRGPTSGQNQYQNQQQQHSLSANQFGPRWNQFGQIGHGRGPNQQHVGNPQGVQFVHGQGPTPNLNNQHIGQNQYQNQQQQQQQHSSSADQFGPGWNQFGQVGHGGGPNQQHVGNPQGAQFVHGRGPTPNLNNQHSGQNQYQNQQQQQQQHSSSANQFGPGWDQFDQVGHGQGPNQQHVGNPQGAQFVHAQGPTTNLNNQHSGQNQYRNQQQHSSSVDQFGTGWNHFGQIGHGRGPNQQHLGSPLGAQFVHGQGPTPNLDNQHSGENQYQNQQQHSSSSDQFGSGSNQFMNNKNSWNEDY